MLIVRNGKVLTMTGEVFEPGFVLIQKGKIAGVGADTDDAVSAAISAVLGATTGATMDAADCEGGSDLDCAGERMIDARGGYILPGFIDAHCHVGLCEDGVGMIGDDTNELTDPVTPQLRAIDGIYQADRAFGEACAAGVTTVVTGPGSGNVIAGQFAAIKTAGKRIEDMILRAPVAMKAAFGENPKSVYGEKKQAPSTRMATAAILRETLIRARDYKQKLWEYQANPDSKTKPDFDIKLDNMLPVMDGTLAMKMHAHRSDDILTGIRIAKEFGIKITLDHCTEGHMIADIIQGEGISAIVGPFIADRSKIELQNLTPATAGVLARAGVKVAIMTDHPCTPVQYLPLCAAVACREGLDEQLALKAITIHAAEITGLDDHIGSIEAGKDADIVILDGHPFHYMTKVMYTIINGRIEYENDGK